MNDADVDRLTRAGVHTVESLENVIKALRIQHESVKRLERRVAALERRGGLPEAFG